MNNEVASTAGDPFDAFETVAELFAFTFHKYKEACLPELLPKMANVANCTCEDLNAAGLRSCALPLRTRQFECPVLASQPRMVTAAAQTEAAFESCCPDQYLTKILHPQK
jgi:hypothetical protein